MDYMKQQVVLAKLRSANQECRFFSGSRQTLFTQSWDGEKIAMKKKESNPDKVFNKSRRLAPSHQERMLAENQINQQKFYVGSNKIVL